MSKITAVYVCSNCDAQSPKWSGRCLSCGAWGSIGKEPVVPNVHDVHSVHDVSRAAAGTIRSFDSINNQTPVVCRLSSGLDALDLVLGGGLVPGSATLIAGEPGMGKSTLLSQVAVAMTSKDKKVIYVTGEESPTQINIRLSRLSQSTPSSLSYLDDTRADIIAATLEAEKPDLAIIDSIQSLTTEQASGEAGSVSQVKACAAILTQTAKKTGVPVILVGQVTKDGEIAGPRVLEHVVDTVLSLEGDKLHRFRVLRVIKHRFGSTDETALFDMQEDGLHIITNPSLALLDTHTAVPGSAVGCVLEGRRPLLVELQALVTAAGYSAPVRKSTGFDAARLNMMLAVLTRHAGVSVYDKDVYANVAGGLSVRDPGADLALAAAIASAVKNKPLNAKTAYFGEIGLTGELRPVALPELRIKEIIKMGFTTVICPTIKTATISGIEVVQCKTVREALA
ncbi:MAG: DNA repair protein RadA [Patescibacteria group bacterium]|nr:DNA repair protein RadA [Patescibacteria group bacterium]